MAVEVSVLVEGGKAAAGATLGSALGPLGVNVGQVVAKINEETRQFAGMRVPVVIRVDPGTRAFTLVVGRPPVAALLLKEAGKEKGSGKPKGEVIGDVSLAAVQRIADAKGDDLFGRSIEERMNQVIGTCVSLGLTVGGEDPRTLLKTRVAARGAR
ncbi:MAG TPA: 50S ribosomal protein L11 [Thermoplasmata archaeon]|nr:50S ribosomal protein L11 [Thermoplasmata archaeon]